MQTSFTLYIYQNFKRVKLSLDTFLITLDIICVQKFPTMNTCDVVANDWTSTS